MSETNIKDSDFDLEDNRENALNRIRSSGTVMMSPELFEKLYLQPMGNVKGDLRKTFANPTPLGLLGFVLGLTPLACNLIGWRGSGGLGAANMYARSRHSLTWTVLTPSQCSILLHWWTSMPALWYSRILPGQLFPLCSVQCLRYVPPPPSSSLADKKKAQSSSPSQAPFTHSTDRLPHILPQAASLRV